MSAVFAAKEAVLAVLDARAGLDGVNLMWAGPTKDEDFGGRLTGDVEMVYLAESEEASDWQQIGGGARREDFSLGLVVFVEQAGDDPKTTEQRARAIWTEVEDALRDDLFAPGGLLRAAGVLQFGEIRRTVTTGPSSAEKWGARIDVTADFQARNI